MARGRRSAIFLLLGALLPVTAPEAQAASTQPPVSRATIERISVLEARNALRHGERRRFDRLAESVRNNPLHPWLRYIEFRGRFGRHSESAIEAFLATVPDSPMADFVRMLWLDRLAGQHRWTRFLEVYASVSPYRVGTRLRCLQARALLETDDNLAGFEATARLWRVPRSQHKACDRTFALWVQRGGRTSEHLWDRIEISLGRDNRDLAAYLARLLDEPDRTVAEHWVRDYHRPARLVAHAGRVRSEPAWRRPVEAAIASIARRTPDAAARAWQGVSEEASSLPAELDAFASWRIGLGYAQEHRIPEAVDWIERVPASYRSPRLLGVLTLLAFAEGRWAASLAALDALPPKTRGELRWQYWRARTLTALGRSEEAPWAEIAARRDYYGFLAADRTGAPYRIVQHPAGSAVERIGRIEQMGGYRRAEEFHALGLRNEVNREWSHLVQSIEGEDLVAAAELAARHGWHFKAIRATARAGALDRLDLRFPLAWRDEAATSAGNHGIDPAWVLATIRMESAFQPHARSPAGALGLMQIMPATGRRIARAAGVRYHGNRILLDPKKNIRLGSAYLRRLLDRMQGHPVLASAAYNAGPHRAERWLAAGDGLDPDLWVELIPYTETRRYVKRVMEYRIVYQHRLGDRPDRLSDLLRPLPPPSGESGRSPGSRRATAARTGRDGRAFVSNPTCALAVVADRLEGQRLWNARTGHEQEQVSLPVTEPEPFLKETVALPLPVDVRHRPPAPSPIRAPRSPPATEADQLRGVHIVVHDDPCIRLELVAEPVGQGENGSVALLFVHGEVEVERPRDP